MESKPGPKGLILGRRGRGPSSPTETWPGLSPLLSLNLETSSSQISNSVFLAWKDSSFSFKIWRWSFSLCCYQLVKKFGNYR